MAEETEVKKRKFEDWKGAWGDDEDDEVATGAPLSDENTRDHLKNYLTLMDQATLPTWIADL